MPNPLLQRTLNVRFYLPPQTAPGRILPYRLHGKLRQIGSNGENEKKSSRFECASSVVRAWFENHSLRQNIQHNGPSRPVVLCAPLPAVSGGLRVSQKHGAKWVSDLLVGTPPHCRPIGPTGPFFG